MSDREAKPHVKKQFLKCGTIKKRANGWALSDITQQEWGKKTIKIFKHATQEKQFVFSQSNAEVQREIDEHKVQKYLCEIRKKSFPHSTKHDSALTFTEHQP